MKPYLLTHNETEKLAALREDGSPWPTDAEVRPCMEKDYHAPEMLAALTDEELVERCKSELPGNSLSYEVLVQRHMHSMYGLVYRMVCNREDAEDITQDVFVKAYRGLHTFKQQAPFSTWLYRIATNSAFDALVKIQRQGKVTVSITPYSQAVPGEGGNTARLHLPSMEGPEESILHAELRECLQQVLHTLDPQQARLLLMRDFYDLSYDEIANTLEISMSAVKMRIHRARLAFQQAFNQQCGNIDQVCSVPSRVKSRAKTKTEPVEKKLSSYKNSL